MNYIEQTVSLKEVDFYRKKAEEKIKAEVWKGRNRKQKVEKVR